MSIIHNFAIFSMTFNTKVILECLSKHGGINVSGYVTNLFLETQFAISWLFQAIVNFVGIFPVFCGQLHSFSFKLFRVFCAVTLVGHRTFVSVVKVKCRTIANAWSLDL